MFKTLMAALLAACLTTTAASAQSWTLNGDGSKLAFGSVKKDTVGEAHHFSGLSGTVSAQGDVSVDIDLTSVETWIDIRNERLNDHVFKGMTSAALNASVDMEELTALAIGQTTTTDIEGTLSLLGATVDIEATMFVARLSETSVLITTDEMIWVKTEDLGLTAGIDKLMELAKLPGITRTTPVTLRLIFDADAQKAEVAPAASDTGAATLAAISGDAKAGKKAFRKCKACHQVKEGRNATGPTMFGVFGRTAGTVEGFRYSEAMAASGLIWDAATLQAFLSDPKGTLPGTSMSFAGLKKEKDLTNVIAYLASLN